MYSIDFYFIHQYVTERIELGAGILLRNAVAAVEAAQAAVVVGGFNVVRSADVAV